MDYEDKLDCIIAWAKTNPKFECATFIGISENFEIYNRFTENQETAIDNVFYKWKIDQWCLSNTVYKRVFTPVTKITNYFTQVQESDSESESESVSVCEEESVSDSVSSVCEEGSETGYECESEYESEIVNKSDYTTTYIDYHDYIPTCDCPNCMIIRCYYY